MGVLMRTVLTWLLVLAVPVQAASAATMAFCASSHRSAEVALAAPHGAAEGRPDCAMHRSAPRANPNQAHDQAHPQAQASTYSTAATATDVPSAGSPGDATPGDTSPADPHTCSACASCCVAGGIVGATPRVAAVEAGATSFVAVAASVQRFATSGPDRPPRTVLA